MKLGKRGSVVMTVGEVMRTESHNRVPQKKPFSIGDAFNHLLSFLFGYQFLRFIVMAVITCAFVLKMLGYPTSTNDVKDFYDPFGPFGEGKISKIENDIKKIQSYLDEIEKMTKDNNAKAYKNEKDLEAISSLLPSISENQIEILKQTVEKTVEDVTSDLLELKVDLDKVKELVNTPSPSRDDAQILSKIEERIDQKLNEYSADKIGKPDYALRSAGAVIVTSLTSNTYSPKKDFISNLFEFAVGSKEQMLPPSVILDSIIERGRCWPMEGSRGNVSISLPSPIYPTGFTIDHIPQSIATDTTSAIKEFSVYGFNKLNNQVKLGTWSFSFSDSSYQTFNLETPLATAFHNFRFQIESNHGNPKYTCIYRLRIHGTTTMS